MVRCVYCSNWDDLNWRHVHYRVRKIQKRIAQAAIAQDWHNMRKLQFLLLESYEARLLAVQRVTSKKMKRTPGIDGLFWGDDKSRYSAVDKLRYKEYKPSPFKRVYVPKESDKSRLRPLSVPIIYDRAMQGLLLLAVDPVVESYADMHAYGFRKNRSSQDVIWDITESMGITGGNVWILKTDVHECFDHLSHKWILDHAPMPKRMLQEILQCGYVHKGIHYPMKEGMPQGGVLSPVFTTLVLCGMEKIITQKYPDMNIRMVRYVDDYLFSGSSKQVMESILLDLQEFLGVRGLTLSESKTEIVHISQGFDFIGWNFIRGDEGLKVSPSLSKCDDVIRRMGDVISQGRKWKPEKLIEKLNDIISGWACYHMYKCAPESFYFLDDQIVAMIWDWLVVRHPEKERDWLLSTYWSERIGNERIFSFGESKLLRFEDVTVRERAPLNLRKNPYIDIEYFRTRQKVWYEYNSGKVCEYKQRIW
ncbi:MAG: reverse transcriptase domain-containing protein [Bacilli bacterium]|nr:reverse transcriptase domain-containing protein [Bacilli bacterium]